MFCECLSQCPQSTCRKTLNYMTENETFKRIFDIVTKSKAHAILTSFVKWYMSRHIVSFCDNQLVFYCFIVVVISKQWAQAESGPCYQTYFQDFFPAIVHNSFNRRGPCVRCKPYESRSLCSNATIIGSFSKKKTLSIVQCTVQRKVSVSTSIFQEFQSRTLI